MTCNSELLARWTIKPAWRSRVASRNSLSFSNTRRICYLEKSGSVGGHGASNGSSRASQRGNGASRLAMYRISAGKLSTNRPIHCRRIPDKNAPIPSDGKGFPFVPVHKAGFLRRTFITKNLLPYPVEFSVT